MAGHVAHIYLQEKGYEVVGVARHFPQKLTGSRILDVRNLIALKDLIISERVDVVVNCIGILNAAAESDKELAVFINAYLPHWLSQLPSKIIHLSTDCVFSGKTGSYRDDAPHDGQTFYDRSKALGEVVNKKDLTLRQSLVGPELSTNGIGLLNWFLTQKGVVKGYKNAIWNGVTTFELAKGIEAAIRQNLTGLYQFVTPEPISKSDLLSEFKSAFDRSSVIIEPFDNHPHSDKSLVSIRSDFDYKIPGYAAQLVSLKQWMADHPELYKHYS